ncbi:MAG: SMC-Scp complex subunit ScpB [Planctomycetia bacterium]|nr:SMC-Scp complex subunit ScpB [Planctomycetia bacterium]
MADSDNEQRTDDLNDEGKTPADQDTSAEDHVLSLSDRQAVFSGRKIHLTPFRSESSESVLHEPVPSESGTLVPGPPQVDNAATIPPESLNDSASATDSPLPSELPCELPDATPVARTVEAPLDDDRPFVFDFLSGSEQLEEPVDSFVAGLQSVFAVRDESEKSDTTPSEVDADGESSESMNPYAVEAEDDELYTDDGTLSPDEEYQQEEQQRQQESIDGMIRQNDADLLYDLGQKYGPPGVERIEETQRARITPTSILEAMLFVGDRENHPLTLKQATDLMRNVSEEEALASIESLNRRYEENGSPYRIEKYEDGWRMALRPEFESVRDRFFGRTRQFRLSQKAIEVLALIAYRQPISTAEILETRPGAAAIVSQLLKRDLIVQEKRVVEKKTVSYFRTSERFLSVFNIASLADLPVVDEVDYR